MSYHNATRAVTAGAFMHWVDTYQGLKEGDAIFITIHIHPGLGERFIQAKKGVGVKCIPTEGWGPTRIANRWFPEIGVQPPL